MLTPAPAGLRWIFVSESCSWKLSAVLHISLGSTSVPHLRWSSLGSLSASSPPQPPPRRSLKTPPERILGTVPSHLCISGLLPTSARKYFDLAIQLTGAYNRPGSVVSQRCPDWIIGNTAASASHSHATGRLGSTRRTLLLPITGVSLSRATSSTFKMKRPVRCLIRSPTAAAGQRSCRVGPPGSSRSSPRDLLVRW